MIVGGLLSLSGTGYTHAEGLDQEAYHHAGIVGRRASYSSVVLVINGAQLKSAHHVQDEVDQLPLEQPLLYVRGKKEQLVRLIQTKL